MGKYNNGDFISYWYSDKKGTLCIDNLKFMKHLAEDHGYCNAMIYGTRQYARIEDNVVEVFDDKTFIIDYELRWLDANFDFKVDEDVLKDAIKGKLLNKTQFLLGNPSLMFLPLKHIDLHFDTATESYFYFKNTVVKVTAQEISCIAYKDLQGYVLKEQIVDRVYTPPKAEDILATPYALFCYNICNQDPTRFEPLMTVTGYLLSRFQDPANTKAIVLLDAHINELDGQIEGGRGKSLKASSLGYMRSLIDIDGKEFSSSYDFKFGSVTASTNILCINDLKPNENFENHFGLTEGITINQKYKPVVKIPFNRSPKRLFTSNHMLKAPSGNSTDRRLYLFELGDYYGKHLTVYDDFGHYFFHDWNQEQWNEFTFFMLCCVQLYLEKGLIKAPSIHLEQRRLVTEVGIEYMDFFDELLTSTTSRFHKKEQYKDFIAGGYVLAKNRPTQRTFTIKLKKYLACKEIDYIETPQNTKAYIQIIGEAYNKEQQFLTLKDVDVSYKTVNTPIKMTKMVKALTKHFETVKEKIMAVDLETTSLDPLEGKIISVAISVEKHKGYNVFLPKQSAQVASFLAPLLTFLEDGTISKVFHNYKFDCKFLHHYNIQLGGVIHDTMLLDYLLDPNRKIHGLKEISELHLGYKQISFKKMLDGKDITEVPVDELTQYAVEDADLTLQLYHYLTQKLQEDE
ncbi:hypothetical protein [Galbibacter pacificus]|uniref:DNA-directed DNA polymerase n=1 Tax=Galbibacter pacificus TaxID=2996052 RepID=A0ABT6FS99_9FLAO|nr:hypothetical protein [Galbibacter pacificus]MDG3582957.1 hypothetical protein [Galbibacter pacificus]MDG3585924.1 hypothetical protein [Galbibacter pacificus]